MNRPLRIALLCYRGNPHCGGQGVYTQNLAHALTDLGHRVDVIAGPPTPELNPSVPLKMVTNLDLYNPVDPFRIPTLGELRRPINLLEWIGTATSGFPEIYTFGWHAYQMIRSQNPTYDVIHDNQSLSYGIWMMHRRWPTVATIHHPITVDRTLAVNAGSGPAHRLKEWRWHSFIAMQKRVTRRLGRLITVSECAKGDVARDFNLSDSRFEVIPNGIDVARFHPLPEIPREAGRIMVTNSADTPLKGLRYLLEAVHQLVGQGRSVHLVVIGQPKKKSPLWHQIAQLGIQDQITFTGRISQTDFIHQYARAACAVVPSLYEGFGLPAGEAMACGVPVICTSGGALPEVVGDAGKIVPPGNAAALAQAIAHLLDHPQEARRLGQAGYDRIMQGFTWAEAARKTVDVYRKAIDDHRRS